MSPEGRRRAVCFLLDRGFPRTRGCRSCRISRAASRHVPKERRPGLREKVLDLAGANPRDGFRRVHALLEGVNLKAVHRVWKEEGLALRNRRRRRLSFAKTDAPTLTGLNQAWCMDFCFHRLQSVRHARILAVMDCFTRECLLLKASPSFPAGMT